MTATDIVRARLLQIPTVTSVVGQRVYALLLPQSPTFPAIRVQQVGTQEESHLRGGTGLFRARVQTDAVAQMRSGVDAYGLVKGLIAAMHGGHDGSALCGFAGTVGTSLVQAIQHGTVREDASGPELNEIRMMCDWTVTWRSV